MRSSIREQWRFPESLLLQVDLAKWEAIEHQPGSGYHQLHEIVVDLAPVVDMGHALPVFSEEMLSSFFPSFLEDGNIPLDDQADRLALVR